MRWSNGRGLWRARDEPTLLAHYDTCINHDAAYQYARAQPGKNAGNAMADDLYKTRETELLPPRQRVAWMAAIWALSVGTMVLVTIAIRSLIA